MDARRGRVLLVESATALAKVYVGALATAWLEVDHVGGGADALACTRARAYDAVVSEVRAACAGGLDLVVRMGRARASAPILLLADGPGDLRALRGFPGEVRWLFKPVGRQRLLGEVLAAIARRRAWATAPSATPS